jgi:hypothetical protein
MTAKKKFCGKCKISKSLDAFGLDKDSPDGRRYECKACRSEHEKNLYKVSKEKHLIRIKRYKDKNRETIREKGRAYYHSHLEQAKEYRKEHSIEKAETDRKYRESHREYFAVYSKDYQKRNRHRLREKSRIYLKQRRKTDIVFKIRGNLRSRIYKAIRGLVKSARTEELVGCSIDDLMRYLENKFLPGMSCDNYGKWHIDHIVPCCLFDLSKPEEQRRCFNYTNLQPLWAVDNMRKNGRMVA